MNAQMLFPNYDSLIYLSWFVTSFFIALIMSLDFAFRHIEASFILKTTEWRIYLIAHSIVAFSIISYLYSKNLLTFGPVEMVLLILIYPSILHGKYFSWWDSNPVGPGTILSKIESIFYKNIESKLNKTRDSILTEWRKTGIEKIGPIAKDYLIRKMGNHLVLKCDEFDIPECDKICKKIFFDLRGNNVVCKKFEIIKITKSKLNYIDKLVEDGKLNPGNEFHDIITIFRILDKISSLDELREITKLSAN